MFRNRWLPACICFLVSLSSVACGPRVESFPTGSVSGSVTLGGAPVTAGAVNFNSPSTGNAAIAQIKPDGTFAVEGPLPIGEYVVTVTPPGPTPDNPTPPPSSLPKKYADAATSGITKVIENGPNDIKLDLEK